MNFTITKQIFAIFRRTRIEFRREIIWLAKLINTMAGEIVLGGHVQCLDRETGPRLCARSYISVDSLSSFVHLYFDIKNFY